VMALGEDYDSAWSSIGFFATEKAPSQATAITTT
jgi:hypothetical protein